MNIGIQLPLPSRYSRNSTKEQKPGSARYLVQNKQVASSPGRFCGRKQTTNPSPTTHWESNPPKVIPQMIADPLGGFTFSGG